MTGPRWLDDREQQAWRGYLAMQTELQAHLNRRLQADSGLSLSDFAVLVTLTDTDDGRLRAGELAEALQWEKSRLSHHLARMQRRGLVERQECPDDARGAFVAVTEDGRRAVERAAPPHVGTVRDVVFDALAPHDVDALARISDAVLTRLRAQ